MEFSFYLGDFIDYNILQHHVHRRYQARKRARERENIEKYIHDSKDRSCCFKKCNQLDTELAKEKCRRRCRECFRK